MKFKSFLPSIALTMLVAALTLLSVGCSEDTSNPEAESVASQNEEYSPASSISMTESEAASLGNSIKVKIYYKTLKGDKLCSETKLLQFSNKDKKTDVLASKILDLALAAPSNTGLVKTLPEGTKLNSVKIKGGVAYVDFNQAFAKGLNDNTEAMLIAYSVANTLTEFKNVHSVAITCDGNKIESSACNFSNLLRNTDIITDIESARPETDYSENVFLEIELE